MLTKSSLSLSLESKTAATLQSKPFLWNQHSQRNETCFPAGLQGLVWPKESSRALADFCVFKVLLQTPSGHFFFPTCTDYRIWEEVLQQPHCCLFVWAYEQPANCSKRYTLEFRKEQFSACSDAHIAAWNLCRSWRLFGWFCASLLSLSSPLHQGMLRLYFAGLQRVWRSLSPPWLSISSQVGRGSREDCCWLQPLRPLIFLFGLEPHIQSEFGVKRCQASG